MAPRHLPPHVVLWGIGSLVVGACAPAPRTRGETLGQIVNLPIDSSVTLPDSFTSVAGCRGFRGGVLISDRVGPALFRVSLPNREAITIGRVGDGPGEFRALGEIFQYRGDSIAVVDPRLRRILLLDGEGAIARAVSFAGLPMGIDVLGSDSLGGVTFVRRSSV